MNKKRIMLFGVAAACFVLFGALIAALLLFDVAPIGPAGSQIGLSSFNAAMLFPHNEVLYDVTEILGYITLLTAVGFAVLGVVQLICRRSLMKVDLELFFLAVLYAASLAFYVLFELVVINYRPILVEGGHLAASFPSSHTLLAVTFLGGAMHQVLRIVKNKWLKYGLFTLCALLMAASVIGRLISGVHWFTDIFGGLLLGASLLLSYLGLCEQKTRA